MNSYSPPLFVFDPEDTDLILSPLLSPALSLQDGMDQQYHHHHQQHQQEQQQEGQHTIDQLQLPPPAISSESNLKKSAHKIAEQRRRHQLSMLFQELREVLEIKEKPSNVTKIQILQRAIEQLKEYKLRERD